MVQRVFRIMPSFDLWRLTGDKLDIAYVEKQSAIDGAMRIARAAAPATVVLLTADGSVDQNWVIVAGKDAAPSPA